MAIGGCEVSYCFLQNLFLAYRTHQALCCTGTILGENKTHNSINLLICKSRSYPSLFLYEERRTKTRQPDTGSDRPAGGTQGIYCK